MGDGLVSAAAMPASADGSWRLNATHAPIAQGLVVSPFGHLPEGCALLLQLPSGCGGAWLAALRDACPITPATVKVDPAASVAITWTGLQAMGLDAATLMTFSPPFQEGMHQTDRRRRLSDLPHNGTVVEGGPLWGGNTPETFPDPDDPVGPTALTVHAALLLYAADLAALGAVEQAATASLVAHGVEAVRRLDLSLRYDATQRAREHFGFADGLSQPVPFGDAIVSRSGDPLPRDPLHGIAVGDVLMGHQDAHGEPAPGPIVVADGRAAALPADGAPEGFRNLGLDGSYLVLRELRQDVAAFWTSMHEALGAKTPADAEWLASRVVGRTMDGDVLVPGGSLAPRGGEARNDFTFFGADRHGLGCPVGSHVRRANPRDGLAPDADSAADLLAAANNHRILRRGRKFGPTLADPRTDDGAERGLLFMCLNTDLARQFEFVQQTWMLNTSFGTLLDEADPLLGPEGRFTIPATPLRLRPTIKTFVRFAGGEYFFLPSILALDYLQTFEPRANAP